MVGQWKIPVHAEELRCLLRRLGRVIEPFRVPLLERRPEVQPVDEYGLGTLNAHSTKDCGVLSELSLTGDLPRPIARIDKSPLRVKR